MIVLWRVTTQCNLGCGFCAYDRRLPGPRTRAPLAEIERVGALLGALQHHDGEPVLLSWLGGEPLLWPELLAASVRLRHEHGLAISATSNGTTLRQPGVRAALLDGFSELTLSIDGLAAFHDHVRGWPGGWMRLRDGVQALARSRTMQGAALRLRANVVLMRGNLDQFDPLCDALADWGIDEITFNQLGGRDRPEFFPAQALQPDDVATLADALPALRARMAERGVRLCGSAAYLQRLHASATQQALPVDDCQPGQRFLFIDEAGRVSPCSFSTDAHAVALAQLRSVEDLHALPRTYRTLRTQRPLAVCRDCPSTQVFTKFGH